jgi:MFS family permease
MFHILLKESHVKTNRWIILSASMIINMCMGSAYAWSVFQNPLISLFGWSTTDTSLAFTLSLSLVPVAMIGAGKIQDRYGPKFVTIAGGLVFGIGLFFNLTHYHIDRFVFILWFAWWFWHRNDLYVYGG